MSLTSTDPAPSDRTSNVRVVVVDELHQPRYLARATALESALAQTAAATGIHAEDMPGLHGLCLQAVRSAERDSR